MKTTMKFLAVLFILATLATAQPATPPASAQSSQSCQCVVYVVNKLFGKPLANPWSDQGKTYNFDGAYQLATDAYWSAKHFKDSGVDPAGKVRYRVNNPTPTYGDVIIIQPAATILVYDQSAKTWLKQNQIGWAADLKKYVGHIGIVHRAMIETKTVDGKATKGWTISYWSTNWPANWSSTGYGTETVGRVTCNDVTRSDIFVPFGAAVSFWRVK